MAMSEGTRAIVREIAFEAAGVIRDELKTTFATHVELHQATCPTRTEVQAAKDKAKGAKIVLVAVAAVVGFAGSVLGIVVTLLAIKGGH
jgi:hypothetical protein